MNNEINKKIFDLTELEGKSFDQAINLAESFSNLNLEGKINAHTIYLWLLNRVPNLYVHPQAGMRGFLRQKMWDLENVFHWNDSFYSQSGQDKFVDEKFFKGIKNGFFVEIGAYDGVNGSNSLYFEKNLNWTGMAVEPSPLQFSLLKKNRKCICINKAISKNTEKKEFIDIINGLTMMSGINNDQYQKTLQILDKDPRTKVEKIVIETETFKNVIGNNYSIDYLSIDVEGGEQDILDAIDFKLYDIKVLSIENNYPAEINFQKFLENKNFMYLDKVGVDEIYYNKEHFEF